MHFLACGPLIPAVTDALRRHGHQVHTPGEIHVPPEATPPDVLAAAQTRQWDIVTADPVLAGAPHQACLPFSRCIVFLQLPASDLEHDHAIDRLFNRYKRLSTSRLYTITTTRVKIRQLPP